MENKWYLNKAFKVWTVILLSVFTPYNCYTLINHFNKKCTVKQLEFKDYNYDKYVKP